MNIRYPFVFTKFTVGTAWYPKREEKISIYLASLSYACYGELNKIVKELSITLLEEMSHIYARTPKRHNYEHILHMVVYT